MKQFITNIINGIIIGIANIIPGLSGSTLAVILGVYEKIITSLTKFNFTLIKLILKLDIKSIKKHISFDFILPITIGIIIGFLTLAQILNYLFENAETYTWSYFFGIITASIFYIARYTKKWSKTESLFFLIGFLFSLTIFLIEPNMKENKSLFFVFVCGIIAVTGMLIPGLSGSYLLVLLGNYELLISKTLNKLSNPVNYYDNEIYIYLKLFFVFLAGHIIGILAFSRIIKWLIRNYRNKTFSTLAGFITGSLPLIWPWKNIERVAEKSFNLFQKLSFPSFNNITDLYAILIIIIGCATIIIVEKVARKT